MDYKELMAVAFAILLNNNTRYVRGTYEAAHIMQHNTIILNIPRATGKTEFINSVIKNGDLYLHEHLLHRSDKLNPYKFSLRCIDNTLSNNTLVGCRPCYIPARFVFLDEVQISYDLVEQLYINRLIDVNTKIFGLQTAVR